VNSQGTYECADAGILLALMSAAEEGAMKPDVQQDDAKIPSARANGRKTAIAPVICRRDSLPPREETVRCKSLQKGVLGSGQPDYDIGGSRRTRGAASSTGVVPGFTAGPAKAECGKNVTAPRGHDKAPR
jgi:hypothetical protein